MGATKLINEETLARQAEILKKYETLALILMKSKREKEASNNALTVVKAGEENTTNSYVTELGGNAELVLAQSNDDEIIVSNKVNTFYGASTII